MADTGFGDPGAPDPPHFAHGHDADGAPAPAWHWDVLAGAGTIRSSMRDMLAFLAAHQGGAGTLSESAQLAEEPRRDAVPGMRIGLGWHIITSSGTIWHNGGTYGAHAFIGVSSDRKRGVVVLCNAALDAVDTLGFHILDPAIQMPAARRAVPVEPQILDRYVGTYTLAGVPFVIARDGAALTAKLGGQDAVRIYPSSPTEFFARVVDARITFVTDESGRVTKLVVHQGGVDREAPRTR